MQIVESTVWKACLALGGLGLAGSGMVAWAFPQAIAQPAPAAQAAFPDIASHWAAPFIRPLAEANIVTGYLDGSFRPAQAIDRDEYAAMLRQAFAVPTIRQLPQASSLGDVPAEYWAAPAIEEAYETGLMDLPEENQFAPQSAINRAEALEAIAQALDLPSDAEPTVGARAMEPAPASATQEPSPAQAKKPARFRLAFPMASTTIMAMFAPPAPAASAQTSNAAPGDSPSELSTSSSQVGQNNAIASPPAQALAYFEDSEAVPAELSDDLAAVARAGVIVNYPDPQMLMPNAPLERGTAAAFIHQALVYQDQLAPLPRDSAVQSYIVAPDALAP